MAWHYRSPMVFPATFLAVTRSAAADPEVPYILSSSENRKDLEKIAETYRWFKWCIKQKNAIQDIEVILETFDVRTSIKDDDAGFILYLMARRTKLSEFERLNPRLAREINNWLSNENLNEPAAHDNR